MTLYSDPASKILDTGCSITHYDYAEFYLAAIFRYYDVALQVDDQKVIKPTGHHHFRFTENPASSIE